MTTGSGTAVKWPHAEDTKDPRSHQEQGDRLGPDCPPGCPGGAGPAHTLILGLWPTER